MTAVSVARYLDGFTRNDSGRLMSVLVRQLRDWQLAEDSLHDALESALVHWQRNGMPDNPQGWLMQTARRKAIDRLRRVARFRARQDEISYLIDLDNDAELMSPEPIADERLRLIFTCCHPALAQEASVALTLRTLCGLSTEDIARAFVVEPKTMGQRLVRAQQKITLAGIAYEVPEPEQFSERLSAVLDVIYLVFNAGYSSGRVSGDSIDLCAEAIRLARLIMALRPGEAEIEGLLALCLLQHSRAGARRDASGHFVPLEEQQRDLWDTSLIDEGRALVERALARGHVGPFQVQAAIAALHAEARTHGETDWAEIAALYGVLEDLRPNEVVTLNRVVALSYAQNAGFALSLLEHLRTRLANYQPFHAVEADLRRRMGDHGGAQACYARAIELAQDGAEREFLERRMASLPLSV